MRRRRDTPTHFVIEGTSRNVAVLLLWIGEIEERGYRVRWVEDLQVQPGGWHLGELEIYRDPDMPPPELPPELLLGDTTGPELELEWREEPTLVITGGDNE